MNIEDESLFETYEHRNDAESARKKFDKFNKSKDNLETDEDRWLYILKNAGSSSSLPDFDNPTFEDALRRIECDTASDELLIKQADMKDFLYAYSDAIDESFEKGAEYGRYNRSTEIALDMLADNEPLDKIMKYSHRPKEKVLELQKKNADDADK